jgi:ActR/RegA family two-component response regulator
VAEAPRVLILADDLIWADRLTRAVAASGAVSVAVGTRAAFDASLAAADAAIIDLTARAYDGIAAVESATAAGVRVLAWASTTTMRHASAFAAGADRVLAYRKLFENGPDTIAAFWRRCGPASTPA